MNNLYFVTTTKKTINNNQNILKYKIFIILKIFALTLEFIHYKYLKTYQF